MSWYRHKDHAINLENVGLIYFEKKVENKNGSLISVIFSWTNKSKTRLTFNLLDNYENESYEYLLELTRGDGR